MIRSGGEADIGAFELDSGDAECDITGTENGEVLRGTTGDDVICALAGNDTVYGLSGDDTIFGDAGQDSIYAGPGDDGVERFSRRLRPLENRSHSAFQRVSVTAFCFWLRS